MPTTTRTRAAAPAPTPIRDAKVKRDSTGKPIASKAAKAAPPKGKPPEEGSTAQGRASRGWNEHFTERWEAADTMNESNAAMPPAERLEGEFVPWEAVVVDDSINPRGGEVDADTVVRYAENLDKLPPILVQKDTFKLIGGKHRLSAASQGHDHIRIREVDIDDDKLFEAALEDNAKHGRPLTKSQRIAAMKTLFDLDPMRSTNDIAQATGCAWATVDAYIKEKTGGNAPRPVRGKDGVTQTRKAAPPPPKAKDAKGKAAAKAAQAAPAARETPEPEPETFGDAGSAMEAADGEISTSFGPWTIWRSDDDTAWKLENFDMTFAIEIVDEDSVALVLNMGQAIDTIRREMRACGMSTDAK